MRHSFFCVIIFLTFFQTASTQPPRKHWEAVAYNNKSKELAVFSGAEFPGTGFTVTDSLWLFDQKWRFVDNNDIQGRWAHSMVFHEDALYTYGGFRLNESNQEIVLHDLQVFTNGRWTHVTDGPGFRKSSLFSTGSGLSLAGIMSAGDSLRFESWQLNNNKLSKTFERTLSADINVVEILLVKSQHILVVSSEAGMILLNAESGEKVMIKNAPRSEKYAIAYDSGSDSYFVFGGLLPEDRYSDELWQIKDGIAKKLSAPDHPSPRASCHLIAIPEGLILYGGSEPGGKLNNDLWYYNGKNWSKELY